MNLAIGKNPLIVGLGKTGLSCIAFFNRINQSYHALDSRSDCAGQKQAQQDALCQSVTMNGLDGNQAQHKKFLEQSGISSLIVSPGVATRGALFDAATELDIEIIGDIELFARAINQDQNSRVIAITGSNGKSTVTKLIYDLMNTAGYSVAVGGNIGTPVLDLLTDPEQWYVLELSSFQLETTYSLVVEVATVLNLSEDHMNRYDSFQQYADTKLALLKFAKHQVIDIDELPELDGKYSDALRFGLNQQNNNSILNYDQTRRVIELQSNLSNAVHIFDTQKLLIPGLHNIRNVMTVLAICELADFKWTVEFKNYLYQWPGLEHRCSFVAEKHNVKFYNDSKATNIGATIAAIDGFAATSDAKIILIAGGDGKGAEFSPLATKFRKYLRALVLLGKDAEQIFEQAGKGLQSSIVADMKEAVTTAFKFSRPGDLVLLSPACASLDMYSNFEQRGKDFQNCVEALA